MRWRIDHLAVAAGSLAEGTAAVEAALGVRLASGGSHASMATHNRLLGLGDLYLEVIAIDPAAVPPPHPRWFRLDQFTGAPRLTNWVVAVDDLEGALAVAPAGAGQAVDLARGDLRWRMGVPGDGCLPFDDAFPALIQWLGGGHPATRLPEAGVRLRRLTVVHPDADGLRAALGGRVADPRLVIEAGAVKAMRAEFETAHGPRHLEG